MRLFSTSISQAGATSLQIRSVNKWFCMLLVVYQDAAINATLSLWAAMQPEETQEPSEIVNDSLSNSYAMTETFEPAEVTDYSEYSDSSDYSDYSWPFYAQLICGENGTDTCFGGLLFGQNFGSMVMKLKIQNTLLRAEIVYFFLVFRGLTNNN